MPTWPVRSVADTTPCDEGAELRAAALPAAVRGPTSGSCVRCHDAGQHGVLPVVADVGDAVGPAHHLALGRGRRRPRPAVVADAVDGLGAQVERRQRDHRRPTAAWSKPPATKGSRASSLAWPPGPWPQSWPRAMASVSATLSRQARAMAVATWATSSAWVSRVRWWSWGKTKTWVLPARRRKAVAWRMRSRSRSKQVRHASGSSARGRSPAPAARVAPGASSAVLELLALGAAAAVETGRAPGAGVPGAGRCGRGSRRGPGGPGPA